MLLLFPNKCERVLQDLKALCYNNVAIVFYFSNPDIGHLWSPKKELFPIAVPLKMCVLSKNSEMYAIRIDRGPQSPTSYSDAVSFILFFAFIILDLYSYFCKSWLIRFEWKKQHLNF